MTTGDDDGTGLGSGDVRAGGSGDEGAASDAGGSDPTAPGGDSSGTTDPGQDDEAGCGCRSGHVPGDSLLALAGLGLLGLTRRRRA